MCVQESVSPPTAEAAKHVQRVRTLMFFQIGVSVMMLFIGFPSLSMLIMAFLLYMAYDQLSVCATIFYIFFTLFDTLMFLAQIGKAVQNGGGVDKGTAPIILFTVFLLTFDVVAIYIVFTAYKEFKATWQEMGSTMGGAGMGGGMGSMFGGGGGGQRSDAENPSYNGTSYNGTSQQPQSGSDFKAFTGKGIALG